MDRETVEYLRDLTERLMRVPVMYGTDQGDCDQLLDIARTLSQLLDNATAMED